MDTLREIYDKQHQQYLEHRRQQRERSYDYIRWYARQHDWTEGEVTEVVAMLGLDSESSWLTNIPHWDLANPLPKSGRPKKTQLA